LGLRSIIVLVLLAAVVASGVLAWSRLESTAPVLTGPEAILLGNDAQDIRVTIVEEGMGIRRVIAVLIDGSDEIPLLDDMIRGTWLDGSREFERALTLHLDPEALGLTDGTLRLRVRVEDWSWRGNVGEFEIPVEIDRVAPRIAVRSGLTYIDQGGAAAVVYELSEQAARHGVEVVGENGTYFYKGHASAPSAQALDQPQALDSSAQTLAGESDAAQEKGWRRQVAIFAIDRDAGKGATVSVVAEDRAGNESRARWNVVVKPQKFPQGSVNLPASFLSNVVPELAQKAGIEVRNPTLAFERINTEFRDANEREIRERLADSASRPLWSGAFKQLANSKVTSRFADARIYKVDGQPISSAIHYGYDLASHSGADITAANAGQVRYAGDLGIYGNCVLIDHGLGVASLYGHLSRLDVREGESVTQGQRLGLSGATGLAGGDHLHFAILVGPTYVDPVEWWDPKWVREHISVRLEP
jgi:murein DD-endopeptidase MepM/ murein hydrolase activator NlpD